MTIEGAIAQLQELIDNDEIPFLAKPSLQKVMETVEMEREQHIEESKTGKWKKRLVATKPFTLYFYECPFCEFRTVINSFNFCPNCGVKMEVDKSE